MHFYGSASAEPFFAASFPENRGARLRISGGCPARGEPEALKIFAQASRAGRSPASDAPQFSKCNGDDRSQRLKQGGAVGAAASKTRAPLKVRSGCWEPQPGGTFPTALLRQSRFLLPAFPENWGARLRISGGCPARGEPEAPKIFAQASRAKTKSMGLRLFCKLFVNPIDKVGG